MASWDQMGKKSRKDYMGALGALWGDKKSEATKGTSEPKEPLVEAVVKAQVPSEQDEQFVLVAWMKKTPILAGIKFHHSPNGGRRDAREGAKFKRLGTSPGYPDISIPKPMGGYAGLYIELKRTKGGSLSQEQKEWLKWLNENGSLAVECKGAEAAKIVIAQYFGVR